MSSSHPLWRANGQSRPLGTPRRALWSRADYPVRVVCEERRKMKMKGNLDGRVLEGEGEEKKEKDRKKKEERKQRMKMNMANQTEKQGLFYDSMLQ